MYVRGGEQTQIRVKQKGHPALHIPRGGRLAGEELVAHREAEVLVELLSVEVVEADGGGHGAALADEHGPAAARGALGDAAELAAAARPVDDLEVAVGAAAVVVRLKPPQLELFQSELRRRRRRM